MKRSATAAILMLAASFSLQAADAELTVKMEKAAPPDSLKSAIKDLLSDEALRIQDAKGGLVSTIWFRKEIPSKATAEQVKNGLTYREIPLSTVVGVIELPQKWLDYRKQEIPKGVYTLRFAMQPMDGDHMGTAPHNEFCLLSPADKDIKPDPMPVKELNELSAASHGATHPAVALLFPNPKPGDQPAVVAKGNGVFVLNIKRTVAAGDAKTTLGFGLTVFGHTQE